MPGGVFVDVGGTTGVFVSVAVGGTGVFVNVAVGGTGVFVNVAVGGTGVFVNVAVGGTGVFVGVSVGEPTVTFSTQSSVVLKFLSNELSVFSHGSMEWFPVVGKVVCGWPVEEIWTS